MILCDAGGSNNCRSWLWKAELQRQCADRFGISVLVCHYPTGASKYNPIEYRLFSQITRNWAGKPLRSFATMRNYIRSTTTTTGLTVKAFLVDRAFQKGRKVSKEQRQTIQLTRRPICPTWKLYDCTNIEILNLNQTATLFADSYLGGVGQIMEMLPTELQGELGPITETDTPGGSFLNLSIIIFGPITFLIGVGIYHIVASVLGGRGSSVAMPISMPPSAHR